MSAPLVAEDSPLTVEADDVQRVLRFELGVSVNGQPATVRFSVQPMDAEILYAAVGACLAELRRRKVSA